jgi:hypothetical protein
LPLAVPLLFAQTAGVPPPHALAARVATAPVLDGKLNDEAWQAAPPASAFLQKAPVESSAPTERTTVRVVYDEDALYVGVDCEQTGAPVVERLTRRDREVEADWVSVSLDTRRDQKSAFVFEVNAGGALLDGVRYNDTDFSPDWDENWDARVSVREHGWSAEYRIPFRILRFRTLPIQSWGFEVRRYISLKQETDEWALVSRSAGGEVSHYGKLDGLVGLSARTPLELRPFVLGRVRRQDATQLSVSTANATGSSSFPNELPSTTDFSASVGLDLKWHLTQDLTLDATINPDFAQVEADQLVLNLTTFETYYPEKRPFFLEGTEVFATPGQLLYTRRIGSVPAVPAIRLGERLLDVPQPTTIWGASKLTGRISDGLTVGTLQAVTGESTVPVQRADGSRVSRVAVPLSAWNVLRARYDINDRTFVGFMGTSVTRAEPSARWPTIAGASSPQSLCPSASPLPRGSRCFNDAYTAALDWRWRSRDGDWASNGQVGASMLRQGPPRSEADGTVINPGEIGTGAGGYLGKEGGEHWVGDIWGGYNDRKFEINDVGYNQRANVYWDGFDLEYRTLVPWRMLLETHTRLEYWDNGNMSGLGLGRGAQVNTAGKLDNFWRYFFELHWRDHRFDDREMGDGAALERAGVPIGSDTWIQSDPTKVVSFSAHVRPQLLGSGAINLNANAGVMLRVLPQFDLELFPTFTYNRGEPRYVTGGAKPGEYIFGHLAAASVGATLRTTYTFAPRLTLQGYAQLFLASGHYSDFLSNHDPSSTHPIVHLTDLVPAPAPSSNPDFEQGALNVNVVLRWEWRLGSLLYLVYTRSQVPNVSLGPSDVGTLDVSALKRAPAADLFILKLSHWWG